MTKSSQKKLSCPLCGRCIGFDESEEENSETKVVITKPRKKRNTKMYIYATICPKCKKDLSSSFPEKAIAFYLSKIFNIDENKKFEWLGNSELDIYIDELNLGVEYDGKVWHKNISKDLIKDTLCEQNGIFLVFHVKQTAIKDENISFVPIYLQNLRILLLCADFLCVSRGTWAVLGLNPFLGCKKLFLP